MFARRGQASTGLIATACVIAGLGVTAVVVRPGVTTGDTPGAPAEVRAGRPEHQEVIDGLAALVRSSREVLAVHDRTTDPLLDMLLWTRDEANPGVIDDDELGLISHSRLTHTMFYRRFEVEPEAGETRRGDRHQPRRPPDGDPRDPGFLPRWRASPAVATTTIARGISDMRVRGIGPPTRYDQLEITLTWPSNSVDGPDKASILVVVPHSKTSDQE